ncbi:MAG TPA: fumarylacetoacetate hydrolase family protein [Candidatus Dormibacteraeota bacterium]|nr:fumarylacetoacetate hydrolase family protein [Candidatus Dormibacteraeota bacterium]
MKLCRFKKNYGKASIGLITQDDSVLDLTAAGITGLYSLLDNTELMGELRRLEKENLPRFSLAAVELCAPVDLQEIWAAGVTYLRSKKARMEESDFSATAYDRVYEAERPELFFKSLPQKVVAAGEAVGIRRDARWSVPEPELALVLNSKGRVVGYTIGNDMSSRDIEGENLLYLPQAKIYQGSCALGPWIVVGHSETEVRGWQIAISIQRGTETVFSGQTSVGQIKRSFEELAEFLFRSQEFPHGAVLLTGTGVVPPDSFTLSEGDVVEIRVDGVGMLSNSVVMV